MSFFLKVQLMPEDKQEFMNCYWGVGRKWEKELPSAHLSMLLLNPNNFSVIFVYCLIDFISLIHRSHGKYRQEENTENNCVYILFLSLLFLVSSVKRVKSNGDY